MKRICPGHSVEEVSYPLARQASWSLNDLPRTVTMTLHQGSSVTSMDFHPSHHTLLLDVSSSKSTPKLESSDETCKSLMNTKTRRGYKRKSTAPTWEKDSSILIEDGYVWRKYGQKMTLNAKYIRSYYRCTRKNDQGCQAMKQVQRIQDNPPLYRTTYYGHHTCQNPLNPEIILEPISPSASSTLLSFNNSFQRQQENPFPSSLLASTKQEPVEVIQDYHSAQNQLSSPEDLLLYDYDFFFDYSKRVAMLSSNETVEFENVYGQFGF